MYLMRCCHFNTFRKHWICLQRQGLHYSVPWLHVVVIICACSIKIQCCPGKNRMAGPVLSSSPEHILPRLPCVWQPVTVRYCISGSPQYIQLFQTENFGLKNGFSWGRHGVSCIYANKKIWADSVCDPFWFKYLNCDTKYPSFTC